MRHASASRFFYFVLALMLVALPSMADSVTVSGNVTFSSLDGSSSDHDGAANGVFTVNDGDLTIQGTVNCNDDGPGNASACAMAFNVSGNLVMLPGSAMYAENRNGAGNGGSITITTGGNVVLSGPAPGLAGSIISSESHQASAGAGGNITLNAGGASTLNAGSVISAGSKGGNAGAIAVNGTGAVTANGMILSGPGRALTGSTTSGQVLSGGSSTQKGGSIAIKSTTTTEPNMLIGGGAIIVSQGETPGAGAVTIDACGVELRGLVASIGKDGGSNSVTVRSGTSLLIDGRDLAGAGSRRGLIRVDATNGNASTYEARVFARTSIQILGPAAGGVAVINANPGGSTAGGGSVNVMSTEGNLTASGNAIRAGDTANKDNGGTINVAAKGDVNLDTAALRANGGNNGKGGNIAVRAHSGGVSWQNGTGDVRPTGSAVAAADRGTITITYCTTVSTTGSNFPVNGSVTGPFPTLVQSCSPGSPTLPAGQLLPTCNRPPIANNDAYAVAEGGTLNVAAPGVLGNDVEPDGQPMSASLVSGPANASSFTFNANGSFTYVHNGGETTSDSFTYKASDGSLDSSVATVTIAVTPVNDAPVANNDAYSVAEGGTINLAVPGVKSNDSDPDNTNASLVVSLVSGPANASAFTLNPDGSFVYTHNGTETTSDSFTYQLSDGAATSNIATVAITIDAVNDPPVANNDSYPVAEGGTLNGSSVLANDTDAENSTLTAILVSGPANATSFALNANGTFTYVHNGGETTSDSFTYKANDGSSDSNVATVTINITPVNDAPVAVNDGGPAYTVAEGGTLIIPAPGVLGNDTDAENQTLTAIAGTGAGNGTVTLNADGSFTYVHNGGESTSDSFTYQASDGSLTSNVANVTISITPVNDAPVAVNDNGYTVAEGGTLNGSSVLANDTDAENNALTAALVMGPAHASSFTFNADGTFTYVHNGGETTTDSFTYKANDGSLDSNVATVTITITGVNDAPVAVNDGPHTVAEGGTLNGPSVLANDTDAENNTLTAILVSGPANAASFTLNANGTFTYVHNGSETTSDSFTYKANDGSADSNVATVTITITAVNDAPVAVNDGGYTVAEGGTLNGSSVLANDTDAENNALTAVLVTGPANASSFTLNADGTFVYVHNGGETTSDSFTYKASDGSLQSNTATVSITITPVNDPPVANPNTYSVNFHGTLNVAAPGVLGNDTDPENNALTAVLVSTTTQGTLTLNADGSFTYQHTANSLGSDQFTYYAQDAFGGISNTTTVTINIINTPPTATGDAFNAVGNTELRVGTGPNVTPAVVASGSVLANDTDPDNGPSPLVVTTTTTTSVAGGSVTMFPNGSFNYLPPTGFTGTDSFTYTISDSLATANGTVTISVSQRVWYVNLLAAGPQSGRSTEPFISVVQAQTASAINDYIHVASGTYATGIVLKNGQRLIGAGEALVVGPHTLAPATVRPLLNGAITLANANLVTGLNVSAGGVSAITGSGTTGGTIAKVDATSSATAMVLASTSGAITISNVNLVSTANRGLDITGGSPSISATSLNVTSTGGTAVAGNAGSLAWTGGTIAATNAAAFDLGGMALSVSVTSVSASNSTNGITLSNTTGSFAVNGVGTTAGSGGTITNMSGRGAAFLNASGINLKNMNFTNAATANGSTPAVCGDTLNATNGGCNAALHFATVTGVDLTNVLVDGSAQIGINGNGVSGLTMTGVEVRNAGNEVSEHGVQFANLTGTVIINNSNIHNNFSRQLSVVNSSGTLNATITGTTFKGNGILVSTGAQGALISGTGTATVNVNVFTSTFADTFSTAFASDAAGAATLNIKVDGSTFTSNGVGITVATTASTASTYEVTNNTLSGGRLTVMTFTKSTTSSMTGKVLNNVIGVPATLNSGCSAITCGGIDIRTIGTAGTHAVNVSGNQLHQFRGTGIAASASNGSVSLQAKISGNTITNPGGGAENAIFSQSGAASADTTSVCADIFGNTIAGTYVTTQIRVRNRFVGTTYRLPGYGGAGNDIAAVAAFLSAQNGGATASATINANTFGGGGACATP